MTAQFSIAEDVAEVEILAVCNNNLFDRDADATAIL
jgi:hypothetical protein